MIKLSEGWQKWWSSRLLLVLVIAAIVVLLFYLEGWHWRLDLLTHFQFQYVVLVSLLALVALLLRCWKLGLGFLGLALICGYSMWPLFFDTSRHTVKADFTVATINVHTTNQEKDLLLASVRKHQPDLLLLLEVDDAWMKALEPLRKDYPHVLAKPRSDNFGIALFSRLPMQHNEIKYWGEADVPSILAEFQMRERSVCFIGTHPVPPVSAENVQLRDEQIREVFSYVANIPTFVHVVVAGDFNTTQFSRSFRAEMAQARLYNSALGFGVQPTWPSSVPWLQIAIDHVLLSKNLWVASAHVGEDIGSDHYPLYVGVGFATGLNVDFAPTE